MILADWRNGLVKMCIPIYLFKCRRDLLKGLKLLTELRKPLPMTFTVFLIYISFCSSSFSSSHSLTTLEEEDILLYGEVIDMFKRERPADHVPMDQDDPQTSTDFTFE